LLGLRKKRRVYHLRKKGQATPEEYRGLVRLCREEIRNVKAQLEIRLVTTVRDKKMFLQIHPQQKEGQGETPSLIGCEGEHCQQG